MPVADVKSGRVRPPARVDSPLRQNMNVLVIRHAIAEDRKDFARCSKGADDGLRPLTKEGRRKMRLVAQGLARLVPGVDVLASSGLKRAQQTAAIVGVHYPKAKGVRLAELSPGKPVKQLLTWLQGQGKDQTVAIIGHEPHLGIFVSWALTGLQESFVELKKGAACMLRFDQDLKPGRAKLVWALKPGQLRALAGK
jgi:phosphohistidine phosphatase